ACPSDGARGAKRAVTVSRAWARHGMGRPTARTPQSARRERKRRLNIGTSLTCALCDLFAERVRWQAVIERGLMTLLMPGAGPPPTTMASLLRWGDGLQRAVAPWLTDTSTEPPVPPLMSSSFTSPTCSA